MKYYNVKYVGKKLQKSVVLGLKILMFLMVFLTFYLLFAIPNVQLLHVSRTSAVTAFTFFVVGIAMLSAYGTYDIGKRKSKPIIHSLGLAVGITDVVTYIQLSIMNTHPENNLTFQLENLGLLVVVLVLQVLEIVGMTYFGNHVFFQLNEPQKCCVITSSQESLDSALYGIKKFKKQFAVKSIVDYRHSKIFDKILKCDTVFLIDVPAKERMEIVEFCYRHMRNIYFIPEISDIIEINAHHLVLDDVSFIAAPVQELSIEQRFMKRCMDIVISVFAILISSPIWIISAIAIKACDGGPVFFKQKRATKNGEVFEVYKFRTMRQNVENRSVTSDDDRITPIGKILRRIRMDELPQFLNILKGEMSVVGPRPEMLENVYEYTNALPEFAYRLRVKAGLTGYAQIAGKYNTSPRDKLVLDLMYIENYSFWKDIKLVLQTLIVFFKSDSTEAFGEKDTERFVPYHEDEHKKRR